MKPQWKKAWVKALRSGEYEQGKHYLCNPEGETDRFCCLGVLCDLRARKSKDLYWEEGHGDLFFKDRLFSLGVELKGFFRLTDKEEQTLMEMNDKGKSFDEIADYIEENL